MVSGLLSALHNLSEVELKQHGIESINMGGLSWVYLDEKDYNMLFICADDKGTNPNVMRSRLEVIKNAFLKEYNLTPEGWKETWRGSVAEYENFGDTTDILISQWKQAEKIMNTAELFDLLGIYQQIFNLYVNIIKLNFFGDTYKEVVGKISEILEGVKSIEQFKDDPEIAKIQFDEKGGWNIISINPGVADHDNLQKVLLHITRRIRDYISEKLGHMLALHSYSQEIFPFLLSNWSLLKKLNLDKKLMTIFLNH